MTLICSLLLASSLAEALPCTMSLLLVVMMLYFVMKKAIQKVSLHAGIYAVETEL